MRYLLLPLLTLTACGPLFGHPGAPLSVTVQHSGPTLAPHQALGTVTLEYTVDGCDNFDAMASIEEFQTSHETWITPRPTDHGTWISVVPVDALHAEVATCHYDDFHRLASATPVELRIRVDCNQDHRTAVSEPWAVDYQPGTSIDLLGEAEVLFTGRAKGSFDYLGSTFVGHVDSSGQSFSGFGRNLSFPALVKETDTGPYLFETADPTTFDLGGWGGAPDQLMAATRVKFGYDFAFSFPTDMIPGRVRDAVRLGNDDLIVSEATRSCVLLDHATHDCTFVSRIDPLNATSGLGVSIQHLFSDEMPLTKVVSYEGAPALFLRDSYDSDSVNVRRLDGTLAAHFMLEGSGRADDFVVNPSGDRFAYLREGAQQAIFVQDKAGTAQQLTPINSPRFGTQLAWLADGALLIYTVGTPFMELHRPGQPGFTPLNIGPRTITVDRDGPSPITAVVPLARGGFGLLTWTGVQLFDATGAVRGGADPLPAVCRQRLTADVFVATDDDIVTLGVSGSTLSFKLPASTP